MRFFDPKRKKLKNLVLLRENFPNPEVAEPNQREQQKDDPTRVKSFPPGPITT